MPLVALSPGLNGDASLPFALVCTPALFSKHIVTGLCLRGTPSPSWRTRNPQTLTDERGGGGSGLMWVVSLIQRRVVRMEVRCDDVAVNISARRKQASESRARHLLQEPTIRKGPPREPQWFHLHVSSPILLILTNETLNFDTYGAFRVGPTREAELTAGGSLGDFLGPRIKFIFSRKLSNWSDLQFDRKLSMGISWYLEASTRGGRKWLQELVAR
ncbi:hypothetical protein ONS96_003161 [Cadophora gregata f. sp. sojae]|nr:hypothetical protein ONS96_003161 [Cadophora gregata f. sp. sojae]